MFGVGVSTPTWNSAGLALTHVAHFSSVDSPLATGSSDALRQRSQDKQHPDHKHLPVEDSLQMNSAPAPLKKTYKEALLSPATPATKPPSLPFPPRSLIAPLNWSSTLSKETIVYEFANRYGGYPNDFLVARYSERDFVVFLMDWVQCDQLIRRELISLRDLRLRCFSWDP
uniref:Uncharacterized protein n=1 Tax=Ananas comosus var. bracteatus TaxID=296719 RepID=A0A6V7PM52_ANACO|nr:unnamed protein product [Ananas comosus var. bracteatus]